MSVVQIILCLYLFQSVFGLLEEPCTTTNGIAGSCVPAFRCLTHVTLTPQTRNSTEAQNAHCGSEGSTTKVCCPPASIRTDFIAEFPEPPVCGSSNYDWSGKIYGGNKAKLGNFPWMALLGYNVQGTTEWLCGGSLISSHHVLTAAHCLYNNDGQRVNDLYIVRLGELDYSSNDDGTAPLDIPIKTKFVHEHYGNRYGLNDIGLLILEKDVEFTDFIKPICLQTRGSDRKTAVVAGWGVTETKKPSPYLMMVEVPIISNEDCAAAYPLAYKLILDESVLCAGSKEGKKDACKGDSGGPLMVPNYDPKTQKFYASEIGIVANGYSCPNRGVYMRISYFLPWLEQNVLGKSEA